jgi:hypothetical protein
MRRSSVLSLPLQLVFPGSAYNAATLKLSMTTLNITTQSTMTLSQTTLSIMMPCIATISVTTLKPVANVINLFTAVS